MIASTLSRGFTRAVYSLKRFQRIRALKCEPRAVTLLPVRWSPRPLPEEAMGLDLCRCSRIVPVACAAVLLIVMGGISAYAQVPPDPQETPQLEIPRAEPPPPDVQTPPSGEKPMEPGAHGTRLQWKDLPLNIARDEKAIWTSPLHINRSNAKWWLLFGGSAAALIATDRKISEGLPNTDTQVKVSKWTSRRRRSIRIAISRC